MKPEDKERGEMRPLHEKVYLSCYLTPLYRKEIAEFIYNTEDNRRLSHPLRWMSNGDKGSVWLEKNPYPKLLEPLKEKILSHPKDKKGYRRAYYYAKPEPLLESIIKDLSKNHVTLSDFEKEKLKELLDSEQFRKFVHNNIHEYKREFILGEYPSNFSLIKDALGLQCLITVLYDSIKKKNTYKFNKENQKRFEESLSNTNIDIMPEISYLLENIDNELVLKLSQLNTPYSNLIRKLFNMFTKFNEESLRLYNE
jgi:hypothetical protein